MNRVENAISQGRCVLAIGGRALQSPEVQAELRRRDVPAVALGSEAINPAAALSGEALAPVFDREGGVLVLVEPEGAVDGRALGELEKLVSAAKHKPRLVVAAKAFNPFGLPMALRTLKFEQEKARAVDFIAGLPTSTATPAAPAARSGKVLEPAAPARRRDSAKDEARKAEAARAPRPVLVGREEPLAELSALLGAEGGPIVVTGPQGVGKRWLVEAALSASGKQRLPDFTFAHGNGIDCLLARFAQTAQTFADDARLTEALRGSGPTTPTEMAALVVEVLSNPKLAGHAMVLAPLDALLDRRDGSFYRNGRLELVLKALLVSTPALCLVFMTDLAPTFYREGEGVAQRIFTLGGVRGRDLHGIFEAWHAPEFERDRFGPISERTHGHALSSRIFALAVRNTDGGVDKLLENPKFLRAATIGDVEPAKRHLKRAIEKLSDEGRVALFAAALPRFPVDAADLVAVGVSRSQRLDLLARGLLEQTPGEGDRQFYVHALVREQLPRIDVENFDRMEQLAVYWQDRAKALKGEGAVLESLRLAQESNRLFVLARRARSRLKLPFPDADSMVDELRGMVRRKREPRLDLARQRIGEALNSEPNNTELLLLDAELRVEEGANNESINEAFARAAALPTPEVFHTEASWHLNRSSRPKAANALMRGIEVFPADARLRRRLAGVEIGLGRLEQAVETLKAAQAVEPMMPDTYGMLGEVYARLGADHWEAADQNIEEALRLAPDSAQHIARRGELLRLRALTMPDERETLLARVEELLRQALTLEAGHSRIQVLLAGVLLDRDGDLEQIAWLLKESARGPGGSKRKETPEAAIQRARLLGRQRQYEEADRVLQKVIKSDHHNHHAHAVAAELVIAQGNVAAAFANLTVALDRAPAYAPERALYEREASRLQALLDAGISQIEPVDPTPAAAAPARADGSGRRSSVRRRRGRGQGEAAAEGAETAEVNAEGAEGSDASTDVDAAEAEGGAADQASEPSDDGELSVADDDANAASDGDDAPAAASDEPTDDEHTA